MARTFKLELLATDRVFYTGPCELLVIPAIDGEYGIMAGHEPVVLALMAGGLRYTVNGKTEEAAVGDGLVEVTGERVNVLTDFAERADEIDLIRAQAAKARAEERIKARKDAVSVAHAQAALSRAIARIRVSSRVVNR
jgi:F-type H+-transporting ATPase subunit epsilon